MRNHQHHQHHQIVRPRSIEQLLQDNTEAQKDTADALREVAALLRQQIAAQSTLGSSFDMELVRDALAVGQQYASQSHEPGNDEADLILISQAITSLAPREEVSETLINRKREPSISKAQADAKRRETEQVEERAADKAIEDAKVAPAKPSEIYQEVFEHAAKPEHATPQPEHATQAAKVATSEAPTYTLEDVKSRMMTLVTSGKGEVVRTIFKDHGAARMSEVKPEDFAAVIAALDAVIALPSSEA